MILYAKNQIVKRNGKNWKITKFGVDKYGHTVYHLKRWFFRKIVDETEVKNGIVIV